jgi:cystathionine beta-lyase/cystathionine gamma-synthase
VAARLGSGRAAGTEYALIMSTDPPDHPEPYRGFATRAIRVGQDPDPSTGATIVPVFQTSTFTWPSVGGHKGYDYARTVNPTRTALEKQLASLEDVAFGIAFGSGMAAAAGVGSLLAAGDHVVAARGMYGGCYRYLTMVLAKVGITTTFVDMTDLAAVRAAITPATKLFWVETPTNPMMKVIDITAISALRAPGQIVAVDNTFCSPYLQRPIALGADISWHSTTKYIGGHSDVVGGIVLTDSREIRDRIAFYQNAVGGIPGPQDAYLTMRGAKTLAIRMREHVKNAAAIAAWLAERDDVTAVYYPGLPDHPQHDLAKRQMDGFGGVLSFRARGGPPRAAELVRATRIFQLAPSLGGVESLICIPSIMTHGSMPRAEKEELGVTEDLIRVSAGIEEIADLIADLDHALSRTRALASGLA